jgi:hypothetical protein
LARRGRSLCHPHRCTNRSNWLLSRLHTCLPKACSLPMLCRLISAPRGGASHPVTGAPPSGPSLFARLALPPSAACRLACCWTMDRAAHCRASAAQPVVSSSSPCARPSSPAPTSPASSICTVPLLRSVHRSARRCGRHA